MAPEPPLSPDEETLLGHYRRLKHTAHDFKLEVFGSFKQGRRHCPLRPTAYIPLPIDHLETVFDAID
jgi:hypothetical protein